MYVKIFSAAEADSTQVFNPNDRRKILGKIPFSGTTHFSQVDFGQDNMDPMYFISLIQVNTP